MDISDLTRYAKHLGLGDKKAKPAPLSHNRRGSPRDRKARVEESNSLSRVLMGSASNVPTEYYFPPELIGGTCPRIVGEEEDIVWHAAAEACDSERIHIVWQSSENKIWYLATRSADLATHPNSWSPFAALLPGMKNATTKLPACYTFYGDEMATMMTVSADSLQIFRGNNLVVKAKAERTAQELGGAEIIELVPDRILSFTPVPWYSLSLFEDRARRILSTASVLVALGFTGICLFFWLLTGLTLIAARHDLSSAIARTKDKTTELMATVDKMRASPVREQLAKFADLNDGLLAINGFLEVYDIAKNGKARWKAIVPANVTADRISALGGKTMETSNDGAIIGNAAQIEYEANLKNKKK
ncbi:MAG: hypothetical protein ABTQ34_03125 [Bdellovibrionales bacterium]